MSFGGKCGNLPANPAPTGSTACHIHDKYLTSKNVPYLVVTCYQVYHSKLSKFGVFGVCGVFGV